MQCERLLIYDEQIYAVVADGLLPDGSLLSAGRRPISLVSVQISRPDRSRWRETELHI